MQLQSYNFVQQRTTVLANWLLPKSLEKLSFVEEWGQKPAKFRREKWKMGPGATKCLYCAITRQWCIKLKNGNNNLLVDSLEDYFGVEKSKIGKYLTELEIKSWIWFDWK